MAKSKRVRNQMTSKNERKRRAYAEAKDKEHFSRYYLKTGANADPRPEKPGHSFVCPKCGLRENGIPHTGKCPSAATQN